MFPVFQRLRWIMVLSSTSSFRCCARPMNDSMAIATHLHDVHSWNSVSSTPSGSMTMRCSWQSKTLMEVAPGTNGMRRLRCVSLKRCDAGREKLADEIECRKFWQFLFFKQWKALKQYCHARSIQIMGDIPIFVARDSADVWSHPQLFHLDEHGNPTVVAGVPPDYFSATGQLWGNPLYRWDVMAASGYDWWVQRFRAAFELVDMVRIDHFRGFESYWEVPAHETTAIHGRWVNGPGAELFEAVRQALGDLPIVAENLGLITPEVEALRQKLGFPGMAVLQFAFGSGTSDSEFLPHNYSRNLVVYTGTHDNDTTVGWWNSTGAGDSTRLPEEVQREREFVLRYLGVDGSDIHWAFIRAVLASVANWVMVPLQDVLGLGSHARMNLPARPNGNWQWRFLPEMLTESIQERLGELTVLYGRAPREKLD